MAFPGDVDGDGWDEIFFHLDDFFDCSPALRAGEGVLIDYPATKGGPKEDPMALTMYGNTQINLPDFVPVPGAQGVSRFISEKALEGFGVSAVPAGDFNGDGFPDLAVGAPGLGSSGPSGGSCYVILGGSTEFPAVVPTTKLGGRGIKLWAPGIHGFGNPLAGEFDWDRDGKDDLLICPERGEVYLVFGGERKQPFMPRGCQRRRIGRPDRCHRHAQLPLSRRRPPPLRRGRRCG